MFEPVSTGLAFPQLEAEVLELWRSRKIFEKSVEIRAGQPTYVFYEGPPTANGRPGVHHVQARAYKDLFPRYKTMRGFQVPRKAGWDCHGLPVEIEVEKKLGFSGKKAIEDYGIEPFNRQCRESVMEYEDAWRKMTERIGFWVDLDQAYMTMSNDFVESVWWSLKELWKKDLLYLGYKVVPFCAKDGTPLSSHEVGLGYKEVRDPSIFVRFPLKGKDAALLVWTTTPWTLPGNTGAAVHPGMTYVKVKHNDELLVLAETLLEKALDGPYEVLEKFSGRDLVGWEYEAPFVYFELEGKGHRVVAGDFVTAEDGTGIVHIAPAFGADDLQMSREHGLPVVHSVDATGHFVEKVTLLAGKWFKDADPVVIKDLKIRGLLYKKADYVHSYPHCWRCKNPLMYYATDSWFIRNTSLKERLIEKNQDIDWHPPHIKTGRYGDWLNNLVDWALSRTRYWGTPLPIWVCECGHKDCIGSFAELRERSGEALENFDPHRPYVDDVRIKCQCGQLMTRVPDVIDCWYDSGSMPFAQQHYPFENKEKFEASFPGDFICEGLDQTRGWFNSLHQLGVMLFDSIAYKTCICHGLVLDGEGQKMSKSQGNIVDPWQILNTHGADALRWYLYASAPPELSRRFSLELVGEARNKYLVTLWNTYNFLVSNANEGKQALVATPVAERHLMDRWVLSRLEALVLEVTERMDKYDLTPAARALQDFVDELSNWYVRANRPRFWNNDANAFRTLYECLWTVSHLTAPFTPFMAEKIYQNLRRFAPDSPESVHLADWPRADPAKVDRELLGDMEAVLRVVGLGRSARVASGQRTRQPLGYMLVRSPRPAAVERFADDIKAELNVKELRFMEEGAEFLEYSLKPNLPVLGKKKLGKQIPALKEALAAANAGEVVSAVKNGGSLELGGITVTEEDLLIEARSPEGYAAQEEAGSLVALSTVLTPELKIEGTARDLVRNINELRKQAGLKIGDRIHTKLENPPEDVIEAVKAHSEFIAGETLSESLSVASSLPSGAHRTDVQLVKDGPSFGLGFLVAEPAAR